MKGVVLVFGLLAFMASRTDRHSLLRSDGITSRDLGAGQCVVLVQIGSHNAVPENSSTVS